MSTQELIYGPGGMNEALSIPGVANAWTMPDLGYWISHYGYAAVGVVVGLESMGLPLPGETMLVLGAAGGVGLTAVEIGKAMGARVIAAASTAEKLAVARERGADDLVNYATEKLTDRVMALTDGKGADVCFDPVGGELFDAALSALGWGGRILVVGFVGGVQQIPRCAEHLDGARLAETRQRLCRQPVGGRVTIAGGQRRRRDIDD